MEFILLVFRAEPIRLVRKTNAQSISVFRSSKLDEPFLCSPDFIRPYDAEVELFGDRNDCAVVGGVFRGRRQFLSA